jgi:hypothetical protein
MRKLIWLLPLLVILAQVRQTEGPHMMAGPKQPLLVLPLILILAFMFFSTALKR